MKGITQLERRIEVLEAEIGVISLPDGSTLNPISAIDIFISIMEVAQALHEEEREATIEDFRPETQEELRKWALWSPPPRKEGAIIDFVVDYARPFFADE